MDREHERDQARQPGQEDPVQQRQHDPLEMQHVRPLAADQVDQGLHAARVLDALGRPGQRLQPSGQALGEAVEQRQHAEAAAGHLLVGAQGTADQGGVGAGGGEGGRELHVVEEAEERLVDDEDLHHGSMGGRCGLIAWSVIGRQGSLPTLWNVAPLVIHISARDPGPR